MNVARDQYTPPRLDWDTKAMRYVERGLGTFGPRDVAEETFGPLEDYAPTVAAKWPGGCSHCGHGAKSCICPGPTNDNQPRTGGWMQTFTGGQFWPMDPHKDEVFIEDIAHALSMQCRFAGHCIRFYSVAEHSWLLADYLLRHGHSAWVALWALLHDGSEAYLVDVPRPVKPFLAGYKEAERRVLGVVCDRFGLPVSMPAIVHEVDGRILADERANMSAAPVEWSDTGKALGVTLQYWEPARAEIYFLDMFRKLQNMRVAV